MKTAWLISAALCAGMAAFAAIFALAFWVTRGSAWMLAFFPLFVGVPVAAMVPILPLIFRDDEP